MNRKTAMFKVVTGQEPIKVTDLADCGEQYFEADEEIEAYKHAAWIVSRGHAYRIEFHE
jgi:hypothetical protein